MAAIWLLLNISLVALSFTPQTIAENASDNAWKYAEEKHFLRLALRDITATLKPRYYLSVNATITKKCGSKRNEPYGIAVIEAKGEKCTCKTKDLVGAEQNGQQTYSMAVGLLGDKEKCNCSSRIPKVNSTIQCQYATRINSENTKGQNFLGLMCYEKRGELPKEIIDPHGMCKKWRYPGLKYPRLQIPDYLKSVDARLLVYNPPLVENRKISYRYTDGWPKNQKERTGFGGYGGLNNLGPNPVLYLIVTSGPVDDSEIILIGKGENATLQKHIPEDSHLDYYFIGERVKALGKEIGGCPNSELQNIIKNLKEIHHGYVKDPLNTDNAWMEGLIVHLHDQAGHCFSSKSSQATKTNSGYTWVSMKARNETVDSYVSPLIANYK